MNPRKSELIALSEKIREQYLKKDPSNTLEGLPPGWLNNQLKKKYANGQKIEFNTFAGWREIGYKVKKGEKAFLLWGKKRSYDKKTETPQEATKSPPEPKESQEVKTSKWHPVAYVFSALQVEKITQ